MIGDPNTCHVPDCQTSIGLVWFRIEAKTIVQLGLPAQEEAITAKLCTRHYLLTMNDALDRAGLPRGEPPATAAPSPQREAQLVPTSTPQVR